MAGGFRLPEPGGIGQGGIARGRRWGIVAVQVESFVPNVVHEGECHLFGSARPTAYTVEAYTNNAALGSRSTDVDAFKAQLVEAGLGVTEDYAVADLGWLVGRELGNAAEVVTGQRG